MPASRIKTALPIWAQTPTLTAPARMMPSYPSPTDAGDTRAQGQAPQRRPLQPIGPPAPAPLHYGYADDVRDDALALLSALPPPDDYDTWLCLLIAAKDAGVTAAQFDGWSQRGAKYRAGEVDARWDGIAAGAGATPVGGITAASLFHWGRQQGWESRNYELRRELAMIAEAAAWREAQEADRLEAQAIHQRKAQAAAEQAAQDNAALAKARESYANAVENHELSRFVQVGNSDLYETGQFEGIRLRRPPALECKTPARAMSIKADASGKRRRQRWDCSGCGYCLGWWRRVKAERFVATAAARCPDTASMTVLRITGFAGLGPVCEYRRALGKALSRAEMQVRMAIIRNYGTELAYLTAGIPSPRLINAQRRIAERAGLTLAVETLTLSRAGVIALLPDRKVWVDRTDCACPAEQTCSCGKEICRLAVVSHTLLPVLPPELTANYRWGDSELIKHPTDAELALADADMAEPPEKTDPDLPAARGWFMQRWLQKMPAPIPPDLWDALVAAVAASRLSRWPRGPKIKAAVDDIKEATGYEGPTGGLVTPALWLVGRHPWEPWLALVFDAIGGGNGLPPDFPDHLRYAPAIPLDPAPAPHQQDVPPDTPAPAPELPMTGCPCAPNDSQPCRYHAAHGWAGQSDNPGGD